MENSIFAGLGRMDGLKSELVTIANNIANISTTGFKREGIVFSEFIVPLEDANSSLSIANADLRRTDFSQGPLRQTNNPLDIAIDGEGFFLVETNEGNYLTRAGNFKASTAGELVTNSGLRVLDEGESPVFIPPDASSIKIASDGTLSADGQFLTRLGVFDFPEGEFPQRHRESLFEIKGEPIPIENPSLMQGFQEDSNVNAIHEVARLIEVQRAYERGATLTQSEDERIKSVIKTLGA